MLLKTLSEERDRYRNERDRYRNERDRYRNERDAAYAKLAQLERRLAGFQQ